MTDRELLEMAAKAAELDLQAYSRLMKNDWINLWNPLNDDSDAFRLSVMLGIGVETGYKDEFGEMQSYASIPNGGVFIEDHGEDRYAATRRAIVRAASEIGRVTAKENA